MAEDNLKSLHATMTSSAEGGFLITPNDSNDLEQVTKAILVGTAGILKVTYKNGSIDTIPVVAGYNPLRLSRVHLTSQTAGNIHGLV